MKRAPLFKICGLRETENICQIAELKPDMLGFNFWSGSPRYVGKELSPQWMRTFPFPGEKVGIFVNEPLARVISMCAEFGLTAIQLHGDESPQYCAQLRIRCPGVKLMKSFGVHGGLCLKQTQSYEDFCDSILFDRYSSQRGGSGEKFDWGRIDNLASTRPILLAGGIGPSDIHKCLRAWQSSYYVVGFDLNSCFESSLGVKSVSLVEEFLQEMRGLSQWIL